MSNGEQPENYLLDNNIISTIARARNNPELAATDPLCRHVLERFAELGDSKIFIPVVAIAEIEFGLSIIDPATLKPKAISERRILRKFLGSHENRGFAESSVETYVLIRGRIFKNHAKPKKNGRAGFEDWLPEHLFDNQFGDHLGIDEKDLLIFSCAVEHNFIFITCDSEKKGMRRIIEAAYQLKAEGKLADVREQNWNPNANR